MTPLPNQQTFTEAYSAEAPWDIGRPQDAFVAVVKRVASPVLDAGCGTGETALFLAERGHRVVGIDFLEEPIRRARSKASERGLAVDLRVADALALGDSDDRFATVIDSGLFHVFTDDDRWQYVRGLAHVVQPGGLLFLMCFSDAEPPGEGPRRITRQELVDAFADGWEVESVEPAQFAINPKFSGVDSFTPGGPKAWFAIVRRKV